MIGALLGLFAVFQPVASEPAGTESGPRFERLENGLRIGVVEERGLPLVSVQVWYEVGSASDPRGAEGLCHVTRLVLESRANAGQKLDGRADSQTLKDACYFAAVLPNDQVQAALEIQAARMQPLTATAEDVAAAVAAAREYAAAGASGGGTAHRLASQLFDSHPYGRPVVVVDSLPQLNAEKVNEFARRWFVPGNALVLVVGDVDAEPTLARMRELFAPLEWKQPPQLRDTPLPQAAITAPELAGPESSTSVPCPGAPRPTSDSSSLIAWLTPPARDLENAAIDVLMHRLCNPVDGPLARRLVEMGGSSPRWRHEQWRQAGMLVLEVPAAAEAVAVVRQELERAASSVPSEIELNRARALVRRDRAWRRAEFDSRALQLGWWDIMGGDLLLDEFERTAIGRLPVGDMQAAAMILLEARQVVTRHEAEDRDQRFFAGSAGPIAALEAAFRAFETPRATERTEVKELRPGLRLLLQRVPGQEQAVIITRFTATGLQEQTLSALMAVGSEVHTVDQIRDYLTYHASDIYSVGACKVTAGAGAKARRWTEHGLVAVGPSEYAPQLIELQAELLRRPQKSEEVCARAAQLRQRHEELRQSAVEAGEVGAYVPNGFIGLTQSSPAYPETAEAIREALTALQNIDEVEIIAIGDFSREDLLSAVEAAWPAAGGTSATQRAERPFGGAASVGGHELCATRG